MSCPGFELAAGWVLGELESAQAELLEGHYFECDACLARVEQLEQLVKLLGGSLPPILTPQKHRELKALYPGLLAVTVAPGQRQTIHLGAGSPVGVWVMRASLGSAERVDFEARDPDGGVLFAMSDVPFDADRGEILLPCQLHYRSIGGPVEMHVRLTVTEPDGRRPVTEYVLDHVFENL